MKNTKWDFKNPNGYTLSGIDAYFQDHQTYSEKWDRQISQYYPQGSDGWPDVQEKHPQLFYNAWFIAIQTMENLEISEDDIILA